VTNRLVDKIPPLWPAGKKSLAGSGNGSHDRFRYRLTKCYRISTCKPFLPGLGDTDSIHPAGRKAKLYEPSGLEPPEGSQRRNEPPMDFRMQPMHAEKSGPAASPFLTGEGLRACLHP
jgi:hypothetical protein